MYAFIAKTANIQSPAIGLIVKLILDSTIFSTVTITGMFSLWTRRMQRCQDAVVKVCRGRNQRQAAQMGFPGDCVPYYFHWYLYSNSSRPLYDTGYFTVRSILEGTGLKGASEKLQTRFLSTLFGAWRFWPMANAVNFWFVPMQFRVLYMNVLSLFWTGWLTYVNSKKISLPTTNK